MLRRTYFLRGDQEHSFRGKFFPGTGVALLFQDETGDDDVQVISVACQCPECRAVIPVPAAGKGHQRQHKTMPRRRRLTGKQAAPSHTVTKETKATKETRATKNKKQNQAGDKDIVMPVKVAIETKSFKNRPLKCKILQNTKIGQYVTGQSSRQSKNYIENVTKVAQQINDGLLVTFEQAKAALRALA